MKIRVYDERGRERWLGPGQIAPAGWFNDKGEELTVNHVVISGREEGNPYDQGDYGRKVVSLCKAK